MSYENFTTYTEFDESSDITVDSATKVSWSFIKSRDDTGYLYKDKSVDHFDADFTHKFEIQFDNLGNSALMNYWMLSNTIGDSIDLVDANGDGYLFCVYDDTESLMLRILENGILQGNDSWPPPGPQESITYFIEIVRDDDGGANSTGRLTAYIRTGSHTGALQDTLVADCSAGEQNDFRYIYPAATHDSGTTFGNATGFTQNLDLGEATTTSTSTTSTSTTSTITSTTEPPSAEQLVTFVISS